MVKWKTKSVWERKERAWVIALVRNSPSTTFFVENFVWNPLFKLFSAEIFGSDSFLDYTKLHLAAILPRDALVPPVKNFEGSIQQLTFNGENYLDQIKCGKRSDYTLTGKFQSRKWAEDTSSHYHQISFRSQVKTQLPVCLNSVWNITHKYCESCHEMKMYSISLESGARMNQGREMIEN